MRKQFSEKFGEIQKEFDKAFKELFGGGRGTLELAEDEDILEAGIRIISQPPGKKLQNMMQLSGGEKALTAIALLFAIQNLKPSPFCLLDEIEACLLYTSAGSDKNKDAVIGLSSDPARSFHTCHPVHINIQEQDLKFSGLIIFKKFFCAEEMTDFCPDLFFLKIGNSDILQGFCIR